MYAQGYMRSPKNRTKNQKMLGFVGGDHEEVVPKISFAEILQQAKDRAKRRREASAR